MNKPLYRQLYFQMLVAILAGFLLGHFLPETGTAMKPLGDAFVKLIKMVIAPIIFCTVVVGIGGMKDLKEVGKTGGLALLNFEIVTTLAMIVGMLTMISLQLGAGMHIDPAQLDTKSLAPYVTGAKSESLMDFVLSIVPDSVMEAFARGDILQVLLFSILFGFALNKCVEKGFSENAKKVLAFIEKMEQVFFNIVELILKVAPLGAFGAIAFTVGKYGIATMLPVGELLLVFYLTCLFFILAVLGVVARLHGFCVFSLLRYLHEELLLVLGTSSSDAALPSVMAKMERLGIRKSVVALVLPTGFSLNMIGTSIYLAMASVFIAQATDTPMGFPQYLTLLGVLMLTSKGARGVTGSGFIVLAATLSSIDILPTAGLVLLLGIDRFMCIGRALTNLVGNAIAVLVIARWNGEMDLSAMSACLSQAKDKPVRA